MDNALVTLRSLVLGVHETKRKGFKENGGCVLLDHPSVSPRRFYELLELAIRNRKIPGIERPARVTRREGGFWRHRRECLRLTQNTLTFDICAAPYGSGFYVSWRLRHTSISWIAWLLVLPAILQLIARHRGARMDYEQDNLVLFEDAVRQALQQVIKQVTLAKGVMPQSANVPNSLFNGVGQP